VSPAPDPQFLEVGRIGKAHGLKGEVVVNLSTDRVEARTTPGTELWLDEQRLVVLAARPHQGRWLMQFDGISGRNAAEALRGQVLSAPALDDPTALFVHELIGKSVHDQHGTDHGPIVAVIDNPASDLLELANGRLVPLAFFVADDEVTVTVEVPPGLLDDDTE